MLGVAEADLQLELEVGIGDFEHLAAPFRLRGKVRELSGDELVVTASNHCDKWRVTADDDEHYLFRCGAMRERAGMALAAIWRP
jgi:hypothetical protein